MANVDGWIDFPVPLRRSLGEFGGVTRMDDEQDGPGLGRYRHHTCYQATTCNSNALSSTYSSYLSLHWATRRRGREESKFGSRLGSTTLSDRRLYHRRTERPGSGNDHFEFVCAEQALGRERGFGGVEKEGVGAAKDDVDWEGQECVDRTFSQRLSRLDHRSRRGLSLRGVTLWTEEAAYRGWRFCVVC